MEAGIFYKVIRHFALGVMHAGYHCAEGYPGTPSTEVIDKSLAKVQDKILVGWDVNEAVAVAVGVGHAGCRSRYCCDNEDSWCFSGW